MESGTTYVEMESGTTYVENVMQITRSGMQKSGDTPCRKCKYKLYPLVSNDCPYVVCNPTWPAEPSTSSQNTNFTMWNTSVGGVFTCPFLTPDNIVIMIGRRARPTHLWWRQEYMRRLNDKSA